MSLFKFSTADVAYFAKGIYIPICFYFNALNLIFPDLRALIYIPICFYFNHEGSNDLIMKYVFTFQYVSILIMIKEALQYIVGLFTFQYVSILIRSGLYYFSVFINIYIPICFYFNPSPEFPLLFYLISPLSVDQPKFTNILPYLLH